MKLIGSAASPYVRKVRVVNHAATEREVRIYWHQDFRISESDVGDTAAFEPETRTVTHYKGWRYFLANLRTDGKDGPRDGIDRFAIGQKGAPGREGTWRDAFGPERKLNLPAKPTALLP